MTTTAEVVVIGGGVNGASTAYNLARAGVRDVVLVERAHLAAGASGKSGALVRMHYTNPYESKLAYESLKVFQHWDEIVGGDCGWRPCGFFQVVAEEYEPDLRQNVADQQRIGINTRVISPQELRELEPEAVVEGIVAAYEPESGYADPNAATFGFARRAQELGVRLLTHTTVTGIRTAHGRVTGVETSAGPIDAPVVVLAGGAWADRLLTPLGLDLGLLPKRIQVAIYHRPPGHQGPSHVFIDTIVNSWFRPEGDASVLIGAELGVTGVNPDGFDETLDAGQTDIAREMLARRFPAMIEAPMRGGWAGMIMMSPDGHPIIDQPPAVPGLFVMTGDSGSCFKTAPAVGRCLAEWITGGEPRTADLTPFRASRFAEDKSWRDATNYGYARRTISR
ncbi:MAG TPA: FAD-dependent oxidoreductase [Thermomicrobiaceae bacterium]|nr:FAD-dependent oxidoreductase [Thermomicrobiaceae bacterium]